LRRGDDPRAERGQDRPAGVGQRGGRAAVLFRRTGELAGDDRLWTVHSGGRATWGVPVPQDPPGAVALRHWDAWSGRRGEVRHNLGFVVALIESRLRLVTWKVWGRFGPWERRQTAIAETLAAAMPDVVALQEAWSADARGQAIELGLPHVE